MRSRDLILLACLGLLVASGTIALWNGNGSSFGVRPPLAEPRPPTAVVEPRTPSASGEPTVAASPATSDPAPRPDEPQDRVWTAGQIAGDIPLAASIIDQIESIAVVVDEIRNLRAGSTPPFRKIVPVELGIGTPTFVIHDVPFSAYAYSVRVHSPGLNGAQQTVSITEEQPLVDSLKLPITPGAPFSLLLRDQDRAPVAFTAVRMIPNGTPLGRPRVHGETDNFGSIVFDNMLAGDYEVLVGEHGAPLVHPAPIITVQPGMTMSRAGSIQPQGQHIVVPRGVPLSIKILGPLGYPLQNVLIRAQNTDRKQLMELKAKTDIRGEVHFPRVLAGVWQVDARLKDYTNRTRQVTIKADSEPARVELSLKRLR